VISVVNLTILSIPSYVRLIQVKMKPCLPFNFFITCLVDSFFPESRRSHGQGPPARRRGGGIPTRPDVLRPAHLQCRTADGKRARSRNIFIRVFERLPKSLETSEVCDVIIPSGSCAHMIRHNYAELSQTIPLWLAARESPGRTH